MSTRERLQGAVRSSAQDKREAHASSCERADLAEATVCGVDPSLTATGFAVTQHTEHALVVTDFDTVRWSSGVDGPENSLAASDHLYDVMIRNFIEIKKRHPDVEVAIEMPPTGNIRVKGRVESNWVAATAVRCAAITVGIPLTPMVAVMTHKKLITGVRTAEKSEVRLCLDLLATALPIKGYPTRTNDNVRDGISVAIADLHRRVHG